MILNCLIVDDEVMARKSLEHLCQKIESLQIKAICKDGKEALEVLQEAPVDLLFLDIEMPEINGLDLLQQAGTLPQVILTTSKTEYAYEAFEYEVTDFLKKPILLPRLLKAVEKAQQIHQQKMALKPNKDIYIKSAGRFIRLAYQDILYIENAGDYVKIQTAGDQHIVHSTMKYIDQRLPHQNFLKVHRSFIVNLDKIVDIEESTLVIKDKVIPISRANKPMLMSKINLL
ncbi:MAG: LytTR family DNA-binding domain-containing protein [Bacteroidota bacterium]